MFQVEEKDAAALLNALKTEVSDGYALDYLKLYCEERQKNPNKPFAELWEGLPDIVNIRNKSKGHHH